MMPVDTVMVRSQERHAVHVDTLRVSFHMRLTYAQTYALLRHHCFSAEPTSSDEHMEYESSRIGITVRYLDLQVPHGWLA